MDLVPLIDYCRSIGRELSDDALAKFDAFGEELYARNATTNLTRVPYEECAVRHFVDSLLVQEFVPQGSRVLDIGTGPGFPAWPLAVLREDVNVTALDSNGKMLGHLRAHPLPNLEIRLARAEEEVERESYDVVTGRAVAPMAVQLEISAAWCRVGGRVVPFRTPLDALPEEGCLGPLGLRLESLNERGLPAGKGARLFAVLTKFRATDRKFPRTWSAIKLRPLG